MASVGPNPEPIGGVRPRGFKGLGMASFWGLLGLSNFFGGLFKVGGKNWRLERETKDPGLGLMM